MRVEKYHLGYESATSHRQRCCLIATVVIQGIIIVGAGIGLGLYFGVIKSEEDKASTAEPAKGTSITTTQRTTASPQRTTASPQPTTPTSRLTTATSGQTSVTSGPTASQGTTTKQPSTPDANKGNIVFRDDFDSASLNLEEWEYEVSMYGGYNWEVQVYTNDPLNVFIKDGYLYIKPTLTAQSFSEDYLTTGKMNVSDLWGYCTNADNYGCVREGQYGMLPPVMSGKIKTKKTITYGRVDIRAKIPKGDWLWPAIWMMPRETTYGNWPASGEIDLMESRGNTKAESGGVNHGVNEVTSTLHWGPNPEQNRWRWTTGRKDNVDFWSSDFHNYSVDWNADRVIIGVDETPILTVPTPATSFWEHGNFTGPNVWSGSGKNAPFDHPFFLILNVAVGGANGFFPDDWIYNTPKPWNNTSPTQNADFWSKRNDWLPTWVDDNVAMIVDYVQMTQY